MSLNTFFGRLGTMLGLRLFPMWVGDALMAAFVALTWVEPTRFGADVPGDLVALLIFEGLAIHSTPFVYVVRSGHLPAWILLIYLPFALAAGTFISTPSLLILFLWHLAGALWADRMSEGQMNVAIIRYAIVATVFILLAFVVAIVPFPELGWRAGNVSVDHAFTRGDGSSYYQSIPAYLTVYFTIRAVWHILWWHWERTGEIAKMARMSTGNAG